MNRRLTDFIPKKTMTAHSEILKKIDEALRISEASITELLNNPTKENAEKCETMTDESIRFISELIEHERSKK